MSANSSRRFILLTATAAGAAFSFAGDLDASLEAQKKKAQRRVYSENAVLADQNLTVPRSQSEEEQFADKKLREIENALDRKPADTRRLAVTPANTPANRPVENKNWLTAAVLDGVQSQTNQVADSWLDQERDRQKSLKEQQSVAKETEQVEKLLREKMKPPVTSPEQERLKQYQLAPQKLFGSMEKEKDAQSTSSYMVPKSSTPDPLATIRPASKNDKQEPPRLFSPQAARLTVTSKPGSPLPSAKGASINPHPGSPASKKPSVFSYGRNEPKEVPLTPMEMMRKSSPIYKDDPFAEDHMPHIKTSIWE
jgi:hypothetical protein